MRAAILARVAARGALAPPSRPRACGRSPRASASRPRRAPRRRARRARCARGTGGRRAPGRRGSARAPPRGGRARGGSGCTQPRDSSVSTTSVALAFEVCSRRAGLAARARRRRVARTTSTEKPVGDRPSRSRSVREAPANVRLGAQQRLQRAVGQRVAGDELHLRRIMLPSAGRLTRASAECTAARQPRPRALASTARAPRDPRARRGPSAPRARARGRRARRRAGRRGERLAVPGAARCSRRCPAARRGSRRRDLVAADAARGEDEPAERVERRRAPVSTIARGSTACSARAERGRVEADARASACAGRARRSASSSAWA